MTYDGYDEETDLDPDSYESGEHGMDEADESILSDEDTLDEPSGTDDYVSPYLRKRAGKTDEFFLAFVMFMFMFWWWYIITLWG